MVKDVLIELFPPDVPRLVRWRLMISFTCAVFLFHIAWACGFVPGVPGFALADDVDQKIDQAMQPVRAQLGQITTQIASQDDILKSIRLDQLAARIRDLQQQRCEAKDRHVKESIDEEIDRQQRQYRVLAGERCPLPACEEE